MPVRTCNPDMASRVPSFVNGKYKSNRWLVGPTCHAAYCESFVCLLQVLPSPLPVIHSPPPVASPPPPVVHSPPPAASPPPPVIPSPPPVSSPPPPASSPPPPAVSSPPPAAPQSPPPASVRGATPPPAVTQQSSSSQVCPQTLFFVHFSLGCWVSGYIVYSLEFMTGSLYGDCSGSFRV